MEKRKPTYQLTEIKRLAAEKRVHVVGSASKTADLLGFSEVRIHKTILSLETRDFYKAVTAYKNHRVWQDVYRKVIGNLQVYIKLKIVKLDGKFLVIVSFKEDESSELSSTNR